MQEGGIVNVFDFSEDSYGKIRLYARPKITYKTSWGGGGLIEN